MSSVSECCLCEVGHSFITQTGKGFSRGLYIPYLTLPLYVEEHNRTSVFCSAYRYNSPEVERADLFGDFYMDFDDEEDFEHVREDVIVALSYFKICYHIEKECITIYFSGNKGIHLIVPARILGIEPCPMLNGIFKYIASSMNGFTNHKTLDTKIYDKRRMFRIPNTKHEKSGLFKVQITLDELYRLSHEQIKELAKCPRPIHTWSGPDVHRYAQQQYLRAIKEYQESSKDTQKDRRYAAKLTSTPPCIQAILDNGAEEGCRNITIACLTDFYKNCGKSLSETIELISDWNSRNIKPTGTAEMTKTIRSMFTSDKQFGCSTLKTISICKRAECPLFSSKGVVHHASSKV